MSLHEEDILNRAGSKDGWNPLDKPASLASFGRYSTLDCRSIKRTNSVALDRRRRGACSQVQAKELPQGPRQKAEARAEIKSPGASRGKWKQTVKRKEHSTETLGGLSQEEAERADEILSQWEADRVRSYKYALAQMAKFLRSDPLGKEGGPFRSLSKRCGGQQRLCHYLLQAIVHDGSQSGRLRDPVWEGMSKKGRGILKQVENITKKLSVHFDPVGFALPLIGIPNLRSDVVYHLRTEHDRFLEAAKNYRSALKTFLSSGRPRQKKSSHRPALESLVIAVGAGQEEALSAILYAVYRNQSRWLADGTSKNMPPAYRPTNLEKLFRRCKH
jgi:hypothetical protein